MPHPSDHVPDESVHEPSERGEMYEQSTSTGSTGQEGWQGGYDLPAPGQSGQQQDYAQQQRYGLWPSRDGARPLDLDDDAPDRGGDELNEPAER